MSEEKFVKSAEKAVKTFTLCKCKMLEIKEWEEYHGHIDWKRACLCFGRSQNGGKFFQYDIFYDFIYVMML